MRCSLKNAVSFWLDDELETLEKRLKWNKKRPLLNEENNEQKIKKIYLERKSIYQLANNKITCDGLSKEDIADQIISLYEKY